MAILFHATPPIGRLASEASFPCDNPHARPLDCDRPFVQKEVAIVCDTTENTVRQWSYDIRMTEKRSLHDGFDGFGGSGDSVESTLPSFCLSYKIQDKEATVTVLAVLAVLVVMATPLNSTPLFRPS